MKAWVYAAAVLGLAGLWWTGRRLVKKIMVFLTPPPDAGQRHCPHCGHAFEGTRRYCLACGGQIWDDVLDGKK